jgi:hypothetical protein
MAQTENTAVNRLVELGGSKPLDADGELDDLFVDPATRKARTDARSPSATSATQGGVAPGPLGATARPPSGTERALRSPDGTPSPELRAPPPALDQIPTGPVDLLDDAPDEERWYARTGGTEKIDLREVRRRRGRAGWWIAGAFGLGIGVAAILFWPTGSTAKPTPPVTAVPQAAAPSPPTPRVEPYAAVKPTLEALPVDPAPTTPIEPAAAIEPAADVEPAAALEPAAAIEPAVAIEPTPAAPTTVTIRFETTPPGARVTLVNGDETIALGTSPVEHELDPARTYEVMYSLSGHASVLLPVDPAAGSVAATLVAVGERAQPAVAAQPTPQPAVAPERAAPRPAPTARPEPRPEPKKRVADRPRKAADGAPAAGGGTGTLMLASKPPCEIFVDGRNTGLTTPQRDLSLPAGKHKVTLVNREHGIKETFTVTVTASESVRVVKDLTDRMK